MTEKKTYQPDQSEIAEIDDLNKKAWRLRISNNALSIDLSEKALRLAKLCGYEKGIAESLRTFGFGHIRIAKYSDAWKLLEEAYEIFLQSEDNCNLSIIHEFFGIIQRAQGDYGASLEELFKALRLSRESHFQEEETLSHYHLSVTYKYLGDLDNALKHALEGLPIAREIGHKMPESYHLNCIGGVYYEMGSYDEALDYYQKGLQLRQEIGDPWGVAGSLDNIGNLYFQKGAYREALKYCLQSLDITLHTGDSKGRGNTLFNTGKIYTKLDEYDQALDYLEQSLKLRQDISDKKGQAEVYLLLGNLYENPNFPSANAQQSLRYLHLALELSEELRAKDIAYKIHRQLSLSYKHVGEFEKALAHYETSATIEHEVNNEAIQQRIINLQISHRVGQSQQEAEIFRLKNVELANLLEEIGKQKEQLQKTLDHLKATQAQLIQSEKMASLGELTAGIAHEIQNPLNFVNNFSEVSAEMIDEMKEELDKGDIKEAVVISDDLKQNLQKIQHHGQRASSIVKGMLEHSRTSSGKKELTDINALADEYLRLAYHGLRAKDRSFNTDYNTDFDPSLPRINVVPQDIGRVILNLITNAFYAVNEKRKLVINDFEPIVKISTITVKDYLVISVKDNGNGIQSSLSDKIFQPFFTTKPTGQGTGLGLSLSYDIIKAHGGKLKVESAEGVGTTFFVELPLI